MKNKMNKNDNVFSYCTFVCALLIILSPLLAHSAPIIPISTLNDLKNIGILTPLDADYILVNDIDASDTETWPGGFDPIGDSTPLGRFRGSFDGNGHVISELYIDRPGESYVGLFSFVEKGSITNLKLYYAAISGKSIVGGVAGMILGGKIFNCIVSGRIQASSNCGGIAGIIQPLSGDMGVDMCYTRGALIWRDFDPTAKYNFGGLVGIIDGLSDSVSITKSFSNMNIYTSISDMSYVGGLVGRLANKVYIEQCYSTGEVPEGTSNIGGLIGFADNPDYVQSSVWDVETSKQTESSGGKGLNTREMKSPEVYLDMGWDISTEPCSNCSTQWSQYKEYTYPFLCDLSNLIPNVIGLNLPDATKQLLENGFELGGVVSVYHNTIPIGHVVETDPEQHCYFPYTGEVTIKSSQGPFPPIYISTIEQLQLIGNDPNYPADNMYILANDINASVTREWNGGAGFIPIETFSGVLDGNGYKISGLYILDDSGYPTGLFRSIKKPNGEFGRVQNLIIENAEIYGIGYVGVLAGEIETASVPEIIPTLQNIATSGEVFGINSVGGLAGAIYGGITVYDCSIRANVNARELSPKISYGYFGGVCGRALGCDLIRISFIGAVRSETGKNFGGIAGYTTMDSAIGSSPVILNCYAQASIQNSNPSSQNIGGLIGFADVNTELDNSYSASVFSTPSSAGGLIGNGSGPVTVNNSFWDESISGVSISFSGGTPETTENMKKMATYTGWDFSNYWGIEEDHSYPLLRQDLMIIIYFRNFYYVNAIDWLSFYGISSDLQTVCDNVITPGYIVSQSVYPQEWVKVFSTDPVILYVSDGLCPPVLISTINQIAQIGKDPSFPRDGYYVLTNNIDASDTKNWNSGAGFEPIQDFEGIFAGGGYIISDLYINRPSEDYVGFFGFVENTGRIYNVNISRANVTGRGAVGILAGVNLGQIHNCGVNGKVIGNDSFTGGLVGDNSGVIFESFGVAQVIGTYVVGGLIGSVSSTLFMDTNHDNYFWGEVSGFGNVGGFVGYNRGYVQNSYAVAKIIVDKGISGGFCSTNDGGTIDSSYWDKEYSGVETSEGGEGKTTSEMMAETTFSGWNFSSTWMLNEGITYPFLQNNFYSYLGDLRGLNYNTVKNTLESWGYFLSSTERCDWTYHAGVIADQTPININIPLFSNIDFVVSSGICTTVPDVVGDSLVNAINEILSANLEIGSVVEECN
ncbi:MAG TPA: hypothetical protein PLJ10_09305, partial [Candidatus Hydrogenedens sp.]|nr:hypothetical protein [Candidatus Hydrogenedens sp.]